MRKIYSLFLILFAFVSYSAQASGIFESYAVLNINGGGNTYYDLQANKLIQILMDWIWELLPMDKP